MTRYTEPTMQQLEEAKALVFLAAVKRELHSAARIRDLTLEIELKSDVHNQRVHVIHTELGTESITGPEGYYVHPVTGTPYAAARRIATDARDAANRNASKQAAA